MSGTINLARGWPSKESMRLVAPFLKRWSSDSLEQASKCGTGAETLLNYGAACPLMEKTFSSCLRDFMLRHGWGSSSIISAFNLVLTPGGSYGIDLCVRQSIADLGKRQIALVESPTYYLVEPILKDHNLEPFPIETDEHGIIPSALENTLNELNQKEKTVQLLYTIPNHQNPTSSVLLPNRRKEIVELSNKHDFYIVADEVYQCLSFDGYVAPESIATLGERVFSVNSFSKILSPGIRLGWIASKNKLTVSDGVHQSGGDICGFTAAIVQVGLENGEMDQILARTQQDLGERSSLLYNALSKALGM